MTKVTTVEAIITADASKMNRALSGASASVNDFGTKSIKTFGKVTKNFALMGAAVGAGAAVLGAKLVDMAVDTEESFNKAGAVFETGTGAIVANAKDSADLVGLNSAAYLEAASNFGVFGKAAGLTGADLGGFSSDLVSLAADVASFNNMSPEEAVEKLSAGLRGATEPLQSVGILMNAAQVDARAMEMGLVDANGELSESNKILARQAIIYEQLGSQGAIGDFAKTSDGLANKQRILKARLENVGAELGKVLIPAANGLAKGFEKLIAFLGKMAPHFQDIINKVKDLALRFFPRLKEETLKVVDGIKMVVDKIVQFVKNNPKPVLVGLAIVLGGILLASLYAVAVAIGGIIFSAGGLLVAVAALTAGIIYLWENNKKFKDTIIATIDWLKKNADWLAVVGAVVGTVAASILILKGIQAAWTAVQAIAAAGTGVFSGAMALLNATILANPFVAVAVILAALVAGVIVAYQKFEKFRDIVDGVWSFLKEAGQGIKDAVLGVFDFYVGIYSAIFSGVADAVTAVADSVATAVSFVKGLPDKVANALTNFAADVVGGASAIGRAIKDGIMEKVDSVVETIKALPSKLGNAMVNLASDVKNGASAVGRAIIDGIANGIKNAVGFVGDFAKNLVNSVIGFLNQNIIQRINDAIPDKIDIPFAPDLDLPNNPIPHIPKFAEGGIVTKATLGLFGEAGPEAVIPLDRMNQFGAGASASRPIIINVQGNVISEYDLAEVIQDQLLRIKQRNATLEFS